MIKPSYVAAFTFEQRGDRWQLIRMTTASLPLASYTHQKLPEHFLTVPVTLSLHDEVTDEPVYARIHVSDEAGEYWPPRGHQKYISPLTIRIGEDVGGDVSLGGKLYAYVPPTFTVDLAPGRYRIELAKGPEYQPTSRSIVVTHQAQKVSIKIKRWANMAAQQWYSADTHVHSYTPRSALLEMQAEDLNLVNILSTKWGERITHFKDIIGKPDPVSLPNKIVYINEEIRHGFLGHVITHSLKKPVFPLSWGGPGEGVPGGTDYPTIAHQAGKVRAQGGLVSWAHFPYPGGELAINVALGTIDSIDLFTWGNPFAGGKGSFNPVNYWYTLLNTGFRLPVTAGTDKMYYTQRLGSARTYAYTGQPSFRYEDWLTALRKGRTFVTTGPLISLTANGHDIGAALNLERGEEVVLKAELRAPHKQYPWDRFDIIQNGEVIATRNNTGKADTINLSVRVRPNESTWFAARVYADQTTPLLKSSGMNRLPAMAHTSPIYIDIPGSARWSEAGAALLAEQCEKAIQWAKTSAHYHNAAQRREVIDLFQQAKKTYSSRE